MATLPEITDEITEAHGADSHPGPPVENVGLEPFSIASIRVRR